MFSNMMKWLRGKKSPDLHSYQQETSLPRKSQIQPGILETFAHSLQILNITHSWYNMFAWLLKPVNFFLTYYQSIKANKAEYLYHQRLVHGENFVCAGGVWMSNFHEIKKNLIEPQARGFKLAPSQLDSEHLPARPDGGLLFLLSLSQKGAEGNGDWEAYRAAFEDHITHNEETRLRMNDETTKTLLDKLTADYKNAGMKKEGAFFDDTDSGIQDYLLRYLHYVLFGLDPFDDQKMEDINSLHYDTSSAAYYLKVLGNLIQNLKFRDWPERIQRVAKIYEESPALSAMQGGQEKYKNMTRQDLSLLCVSIMAIAGMVGPLTLCSIVLGNNPLPSYEGEATKDIDVVNFWDQLNLDDRDEVKKYIYECGRLRHPVSNTHKVATENFTARIGNKDVKFKKGTIVFIPMVLAGLQKGVYGRDAFEFNHKRESLCPFSTIFHSFGEQTNGRICPGKAISENMIIDIMIALGKCRRQALETHASA